MPRKISSPGEYLRSHQSLSEVPAGKKPTGVEEEPLGWFESERFTFAARSMTGKPPEIHRGSVRVESGERPSERKPRRRKSDAAGEFLGWHFEECSGYQEILHRVQGTGEMALGPYNLPAKGMNH